MAAVAVHASMSAVIAGYYQSDEWQALQPQTQRTYRLILDRFRNEYRLGPATLFKISFL